LNLKTAVGTTKYTKHTKTERVLTEAEFTGLVTAAEQSGSALPEAIKQWEIWNEPNIFFWQGPKDLYAELLTKSYAAIKEMEWSGRYQHLKASWPSISSPQREI
jgi:hypothetical protein